MNQGSSLERDETATVLCVLKNEEENVYRYFGMDAKVTRRVGLGKIFKFWIDEGTHCK